MQPPEGVTVPCAGETELFFSRSRRDQAAAKRLCAGCPLVEPCLGYALDRAWLAGPGTGVWGGTTPRDRVRIRRFRRHHAQAS